MAKQKVDYILEEDYARYNELVDIATERKKSQPRKKAARGPMSVEQKKKLAEGRMQKLLAKLAELEAAEA